MARKQKPATGENSSTGIQELDTILGGGWPSGSVVLLTGSSGAGKTVFSFQWLFEGARKGEKCLYITLTEPLFKSIKNIENMTFYDRKIVEGNDLKLLDLRQEKKAFKHDDLLRYIEKKVMETNVSRLCIDSITAIAYQLGEKAKIRSFIFELGKILAALGCTTLLISEMNDKEKLSVYGVEEFISDAILKMDQIKINDELQRVMQIVKVRGRGYRAKDINYKISRKGVTIFERYSIPLDYISLDEKISTGISLLDQMLVGGVFRGSSTFIAGSTGTGKSVFSLQFIASCITKNERCLYISFEESPNQLTKSAARFGWDFNQAVQKKRLFFRCAYPNEKFIDEHFADIKEYIEKEKITCCVVDSLSSISNAFPEDTFTRFIDLLYSYLKMKSVTTFFTSATDSLVGSTNLSGSRLSTITDNIILLRHVEMQGELRQLLNIVKVKGGQHGRGLRLYEVTNKGITIGHMMAGYEGLLTGVGRKVSETTEERIEAEFQKALGPIGSQVSRRIFQEGVSEESLSRYISSLHEDGVLGSEAANTFKEKVLGLLRRKHHA